MKTTVTIAFGASIVVANILASKLTWVDLPLIGGVAVPAGFLAIGIAFLCSDYLVEFHGEKYAHTVVNSTIAVLILAYGLVWVAIQFPPAPFYQSQEAYASVLGSSAAITLASVITIAVSQHIDVRVFSRLKAYTNGRHKWLRNIGSTAVSQLIDTVLFITLGFAVIPVLQGQSGMWGMTLATIIVGQYAVKLVIVLLDTPVFYVLTVRG